MSIIFLLIVLTYGSKIERLNPNNVILYFKTYCKFVFEYNSMDCIKMSNCIVTSQLEM